MKFLIISFLVICAYAGFAECQSLNTTVAERREELLRRANYVINLVSGEIRLQTAENRPLVAEGLEAELRALIEVELELRVTEQVNTTEALIVRLEQRLQAIEERISSQLRAIGRQFVSRREIQLLLDRTRQLIVLVSETVQRLRSANRSVSALGLQEEEARLVQLEIDFRATQNPSDLRRLEELLVQADYRVYEIINQLEASGVFRRKRDLKADILARAQELLRLANQTVRALQQQRNRTNAVELIQRREAEIQEVITDLNNATTEADVRRIEGRLIALEFALTDDLRTVGRPVNANELRLLLNTTAGALYALATTEIANLTAANRTQDIAILQREEAELASVLSALQNATSQADLQALEQRVGEAEFRLFEELLRLARPEAYRRLLLRIAEDLSVRIVVEIRNLQRANRTLEAVGLRAEEQELILLDVEVRDAVTNEELAQLEARLRRIEGRVYDELVRLGLRTSRRRRDLRSDVLARANELINITNTAIAAFRRQNRTTAVTLLQNAERELQALVVELNNATANATNLGQLEGRLIVAEFQLAADLRRLGRPIDINEWRDLLITRAEGLQAWAVVQIAAARNRSVEVARVEELERAVVTLVGLLRNATLRSDLEALEDRLNTVEENLIVELRAIGAPLIPRDQIVALERRAEELAIRLLIEIRRLFAEGRTLLAEGLQVEERNLVDLDVELRVALTPERIARIETRLTEAENRVAAELARIASSFLFF
jgi:hypothetical protein